MNRRKIQKITLGKEIGDGHIEAILKTFSLISKPEVSQLEIDCSSVTSITPAGAAIFACLFDYMIEQRCSLKITNLKSKFKKISVINNFFKTQNLKTLPQPSTHDSEGDYWILRGRGPDIAGDLITELHERFQSLLSEELLFAAQLLTNELTINSVDHSTAERYYWYAGIIKKELLLGILDLGVSIPAKLEQKYTLESDLDYIQKALQRGTTTRRTRPGGLGLYNTALCLKNCDGRLTVLTRKASQRHYYKRRKTVRNLLKYKLPGTWCFTRFPLKKRI